MAIHLMNSLLNAQQELIMREGDREEEGEGEREEEGEREGERECLMSHV